MDKNINQPYVDKPNTLENYIYINGNKIELTEDQLHQLGIFKKFNPFARQPVQKYYYYINDIGGIETEREKNWDHDSIRYYQANYCTKRDLIDQRQSHEILNRRLWRFSCENWKLTNEWNGHNLHYYIQKDALQPITVTQYPFTIDCVSKNKIAGVVYFSSEELAQRAIDEIVIPFIQGYVNFIW